MYCYQCEQTAKGTGCSSVGICGKQPETSDLQDALIADVKGISMIAHRARQLGLIDRATDLFVVEAVFSTVTNVNFDDARFHLLRSKASEVKVHILKLTQEVYAKANQKLDLPAWPRESTDMHIEERQKKYGADVVALQELITYGLKGTIAYADHAHVLGVDDDTVYGFFHEAFDFLTNEKPSVDALVAMTMKVGEVNIRVMEMLDRANTGTYGHPIPTKVPTAGKKGKAILVSGHDLRDLELLLKQTEGKGINIYTHGEMLPCHAYPGLKKYKHLIGNYGGAWQDQQKEFDAFPGSVLMTTNCIQKPKETYKKRIFTTGLVGWPGVTHVANKDFSEVISAALNEKGFEEDEAGPEILVGFGHNTVLGVADKVIDAVKAGKIRHFFLIGGCDGAKPGRNYYTEFAEKVPADCMMLTLACGKFRFNKTDFGTVAGLPRLLDVGQCNDAYSAIKIASALAGAFNTDVNGLPLSMILSWYEQKAVCILLSLLHLGIKNIRLGPSLPAFITPTVLNVLIEKFNIMSITTPERDLNKILGR